MALERPYGELLYAPMRAWCQGVVAWCQGVVGADLPAVMWRPFVAYELPLQEEPSL